MQDAFSKLEHFIRNEMRMSHIYQPVMLAELLIRNGKATVREVAKALLSHDASQIEYYEHITKNMVGKVLTKNRGITSKDDAASAFNIGVNAGAAAGQTIFHCHMHLIPRRKGDVEEPRGGVRGVIPSKQRYYWKTNG